MTARGVTDDFHATHQVTLHHPGNVCSSHAADCLWLIMWPAQSMPIYTYEAQVF